MVWDTGLAGEVDAGYDPEVIAYIYTGLGHFVGMRWAEWTAGGRVPDDVFDDLMDVLARGLPPGSPVSPAGAPLANQDGRDGCQPAPARPAAGWRRSRP
jgi:hypothetical protein